MLEEQCLRSLKGIAERDVCLVPYILSPFDLVIHSYSILNFDVQHPAKMHMGDLVSCRASSRCGGEEGTRGAGKLYIPGRTEEIGHKVECFVRNEQIKRCKMRMKKIQRQFQSS